MAQVQGLDRLNAKLKALRTQTAAGVKVAVGQAADVVVDMQKKLCPVDTGALRDSIQWTFGAPPAHSTFRSSSSQNETRAVISAGNSAVRYAHLVEFGHLHQPAHPFFYPGYRAAKKRAKAIITKGVKAAVQKAVK